MSTENFRIEMQLFAEPLFLEGPILNGPIRIDEALPFFRRLDDAAIGRAVGQVEKLGESVSCQKGCSACCRAQPVPVTPPEAHALQLLVESLPEPRRTEILGRFIDRVRRLEEAGLRETFLNRDPSMTREAARENAMRYFRLGLICPFLEDDACGIYEHRPFVCRQYLVTSPAELCSDPFANPVKPVPMPLRFASATLSTGESLLGFPQYTVPLTLALEYAEQHRGTLEKTFDAEAVYGGIASALSE